MPRIFTHRRVGGFECEAHRLGVDITVGYDTPSQVQELAGGLGTVNRVFYLSCALFDWTRIPCHFGLKILDLARHSLSPTPALKLPMGKVELKLPASQQWVGTGSQPVVPNAG